MVRDYIYIHTLCLQEVKALASLLICAISLERSLLTGAVSTEISCTCIYLSPAYTSESSLLKMGKN